MNIVETRESDNENRYIKLFKFDNTVQIQSLIAIIKQFENQQVKMLECHCYTYDDDGHRLYFSCTSTDEIQLRYNKASNPCFDFSIDFGDRENLSYLFSLITSINSKSLTYQIDKKKVNNSEIKKKK